jgi:DNA-binding HxlR family transcriptional regulator
MNKGQQEAVDKRRHKIYDSITGAMTYKQILKANKIPNRALTRDLLKLQKDGLIRLHPATYTQI